MANSYVGSHAVQANSGLITVNVPAGTQDGDAMVLILSKRSSANALPTGWTERTSYTTGSNPAIIGTRIANSEPASYSVTNAGDTNYSACLLVYRLDNSTFVSITTGTEVSGTNTCSPSAPAVSPGTTVVAIRLYNGAVNASGGSIQNGWVSFGGTLRANSHDPRTTQYPGSAAGDEGLTPTTAPGPVSITWNDSNNQGFGRSAVGFTLLFQGNTAPTAPVVTSPNGGNTINQSHTITWTAATDAEQAQSALQYHIQYTGNGGSSWSDVIALTAAGAVSHSWNTSALPEGSAYRVRIRAWDGFLFGPYDESNANFTIQHIPAAPTLVSPIGGVTVGVTPTLDWTHNHPDPQAQYYLRRKRVV